MERNNYYIESYANFFLFDSKKVRKTAKSKENLF